MSRLLDAKVYIGDISRDMRESDLERAFSEFGRIRTVWVATDPPGFGFVQFEDERDAQDAVKALDGTRVAGERIRAEMSNGKVRPKPWNRGSRHSRPFDPNDRCYNCGGRGHYAYDCDRYGRDKHRERSPRRRRSYSRDRRSRDRRSYSRDRRDRSYSRDRRSYSRDRRSHSRDRRSYSRDRKDHRSKSRDRRSYSRGRRSYSGDRRSRSFDKRSHSRSASRH